MTASELMAHWRRIVAVLPSTADVAVNLRRMANAPRFIVICRSCGHEMRPDEAPDRTCPQCEGTNVEPTTSPRTFRGHAARLGEDMEAWDKAMHARLGRQLHEAGIVPTAHETAHDAPDRP